MSLISSTAVGCHSSAADYWNIAQLAERTPYMRGAAGSNPAVPILREQNSPKHFHERPVEIRGVLWYSERKC